MIEEFFYELIKVALGAPLYHTPPPSADEWCKLYEMAKKQSLVGICFAGVQRLQGQMWEPPKMLYLKWMGMAAKIQQKNEIVNKQCVNMQSRLAADGLESCILKGQGIGALYKVNGESGEVRDFSLLRQSGDIDIYVPCGMEKALEYLYCKYDKCEFDYINAHVTMYRDTEVELHWRVQSLPNLILNKKLQKWLECEDVKTMLLGGKVKLVNGEELIVPTSEFNAFYILLHCYHHMFESGLGLRQLMDYYFVLRHSNVSKDSRICPLFEQFGMMRFAKGVMWIMKSVFALEDKYLLCEADEDEGRFLLNEVMQGGNFGHYDERIKKMSRDNRWQSVWSQLQHSMKLAIHYPSNMVWQPVWVVYHYIWKRTVARQWMK